MKELIIQKHQLEQEKKQLDATIEFMEEEIYTKEEKAERERARQAENVELEAELEALLAEGDQGPQTGGKRKNKKRNNKTKKKTKLIKVKKATLTIRKKTQKRKP